MTYEALKSRIRGTLITAFDPGYAETCDALIWNGRKPARRATAIVRAACVEDVQAAVRYAALHGLSVSARGSGHHFTGIAARADIVIDLAALDGMKIDASTRTARLEPAVTNKRLANALERQGLAFPVGHCGSVSISGYLLGGGVGWNSGAWGIACFSVLAVEVVMADGRLITASADTHADVFWAARGAGPGFFGIVTAYHVALQEAPGASTTQVRVYPAQSLPDVADWAERVVAMAPPNVEFTVKIDQSPNGPVLAAIANVFAASEVEAADIIAQLSEGAPEDVLSVIGPIPTPIPTLYESTGPSTPEAHRFGVDTFWSEAPLADVLAPLTHALGAAPQSKSFAVVTLRSNALPVPRDAAFSCAGRVFATLYGVWEDEADDDANLAWLRATSGRCRGMATGRYVGEADLDNPAANARTLSDEAAARLAELQTRYDPEGVFLKRSFAPAFAAA